MRILAIYRHYWPDSTPYARILRTILEHLAAAGHEATVLTAQPGYNGSVHLQQPWREQLRGVEVRRVRLLPEQRRWRRLTLVLNWMYLSIRGIIYAVTARRFDLIISNSHPPVVMGCALRIIHRLRGIPYIYHCQDLHPESAVAAGDLKRGWLYRLLLRADAGTCRRAQRVIVLSDDMARSLAARGLGDANIAIINNPPLPVDATTRTELPPPLDAPASVVRFLFAGNMGRFQGLDRLVAATRLIPPQYRFQLIFMGEGSAKRALVAQAGEQLSQRIIFLPQQPPEAALAAMRACDYGVVSLVPDVYRYAYPSKSMSYLSAGCPLVALIEPLSELARTVTDHDLGYVVAGRSEADIAAAMTRAIAERDRWTPERRRAIVQACDRLFGEKRMLEAWDQLLAPAPNLLQHAA